MKKTLITLSFLSAFAFSAHAQDTAPSVAPSGSEFKPSAGNVTVEVNANSPFNSTDGDRSIFGLSNGTGNLIPSLRFRYFINESLAFRLQFTINANRYNQDLGTTTDGGSSTTTVSIGSTTTTSSGAGTLTNPTPQYKLSSSSFLVGIAPGLEIHKNISERLSVYYGGYIDFAMQSARGKVEGKPGSFTQTVTENQNGSTTTTTTNVSAASGDYLYEVRGQNIGSLQGSLTPSGNWNNGTPSFGGATPDALRANNASRGFTRIGVIGVIGADYYVTKGLYLGLEVGWGYTNYIFKRVTAEEKITNINLTRTTTSTNGVPTTLPASPDPVNGSNRKIVENRDSNWNLTPSVNAGFRLGFWF